MKEGCRGQRGNQTETNPWQNSCGAHFNYSQVLSANKCFLCSLVLICCRGSQGDRDGSLPLCLEYRLGSAPSSQPTGSMVNILSLSLSLSFSHTHTHRLSVIFHAQYRYMVTDQENGDVVCTHTVEYRPERYPDTEIPRMGDRKGKRRWSRDGKR